MTEHHKNAYRHLLYWAMLDIRIYCQSRGRPSHNPFAWRRQYQASRFAGALADWLHNLADSASQDFARFDEQRFWQEHAGLCRRLPEEAFERYREHFDRRLAELSDGNAQT